jgi:osmoprotectant transport system substrate-binding protein
VSRGRRCRTRLALACLGAALMLPSCRDPATPPAAGRDPTEVVVASFNFPESTLVAEIYATALQAAGIPVRRELGLGPRELVQPALLGGLVDVVPEYLGTALASVHAAGVPPGDPGAVGVPPGDPAAARQALARALDGRGVRVLDPAEAQNQNGVVVARATAEHLGLSKVSDLAAHSSGFVLGGPPECPERPYCLPGLEGVYGLRFGGFLPLDTEQQRAAALVDGVVDAAVMFTSDGRLATGDLVLLADDRGLQPSENLVPVVSARALDRHGPRLAEVLDAVSARLTANGLRFLNWRVSMAGKDVATEARGWLERQSLIRPAA